MTDKIDFRKAFVGYRAKHGVLEVVDVPEMQYLMIDGRGDPNTAPEYLEAIQALYPVAYAVRAASKRELGRDYVVPPLEGLWWSEDMGAFTTARDTSRWSWTLMLMTPDWIDHTMFDAALAAVAASKAPTRLGEVRLAVLHEGRCVQTLHIGSFDDEGPVLEAMHRDFIPGHGLRMTGTHHEIYLSDPRRVEAARLRTILRQPVVPA